MAYPEKYKLTTVYSKEYIEKYMDVYRQFHEKLSPMYDDEQALASAVHTAMIAFTKAAGMDMTGVITFDENAASPVEEFKTFAELKEEQDSSYQKKEYGGGYAKQPEKPAYQGGSGGFQKPAYGEKKKYDGPSAGELKGPISKGQLDKVNEFMNSNNPAIRAVVNEFMADKQISDPEEMSKADASVLIDACYKAKGRR